MTCLRLALVLLIFTLPAATQEPAAQQGPGPGDGPGATLEFGGLTFVWCPAGSYEAGSNTDAATLAKTYGGAPEWYADEFPRRKVDIGAGFWLSRTEVTRAQWSATMNSEPWGEAPALSDDSPATHISWEDANAFTLEFSQKHHCAARLPLESEWEYACRAGSPDTFHFGPDPASLKLHAQFRLNAERGLPRPVGERGPNAWGFHDMLGNVWEWCQDKYTLPGAASASPAGAAFRIVRGGAANSTAAQLRSSYRTALTMDAQSPRIGLRLVIDP